jgi:hypothetical protein
MPPSPGPTGKTRFLQAFEAAGRDAAKIEPLQGAPVQPATVSSAESLWDRINAHFDKPLTDGDQG